jgi:hypothetical protein
VAVAPDQVLAAAHCLFGQATGHPMQPQSLHPAIDWPREFGSRLTVPSSKPIGGSRFGQQKLSSATNQIAKRYA